MVDFTKDKTWAAAQVIENDADSSNVGKSTIVNVSDFNAAPLNSFFTGTDSGSNSPSTGGFYQGIHCSLDTTSGAQFLMDRVNDRAFMRREVGSVFEAYVEFIHTGNAASLPISTAFAPEADNTHSLGDASGRWSEVFAGTGTINTSDAREKTEIAPFTFDEIEASKQLASEIGTYKFLASVDKKGDLARTHIGLTVQRAIEIMTANNLDPMSYGFICFDSWAEKGEAILDSEGEAVLDADDQPTYKVIKEAGDRYGFRYDQLNQFIIAGFNARLDAAGI